MKLDDIYLRLLIESLPANMSMSRLEAQRLIQDYHDGTRPGAYGELIKQVYSRDLSSDIGLSIGSQLIPTMLCDLSRWFCSAKDIQTMVYMIDNFHHLHGGEFYVVIHSSDQASSMALTFPHKPHLHEAHRRFCAETILSYALNALRDAVGNSIKPTAMYFEYPRPEYAQRYEQLFNCKPVFDAPLTLLEFDRGIIEQTSMVHSPVLHEVYLKRALDSWHQSNGHRDLLHRAITTCMRDHPASLNNETLADQLNISVRGLQKHLKSHGSSISQVVHLARRELCKVYLIQQQAGIETTAEQLGFQSISGFRRFFKNEFGLVPNEFLSKYGKAQTRLSTAS